MTFREKIILQGSRLFTALAWLRFSRRRPIREREVGVVAQHGIGDHFLVCGFAAEIHKKLGLNVVVAGRPNMNFIAGLFQGVVRYERLPRILWGKQLGGRELVRGTWSYGHFKDMELARAIGFKGFELLDAYRCLFGLNINAPLEQPRLPTRTEMEEGDSYLRSLSLPVGRTAIVCPLARSTPQSGLNAEEFRHFLVHLRESGWSVLVNSENTAISKCSALIPLHLFRAITLQAGGFLGVRSGLCDLISDLDIRAMVLYADTSYLGGHLHAGTSIANYGFPHGPAEVIVRSDGIDEASAAVREYFSLGLKA